MKKSVLPIVTLIILMNATSALADCLPLYRDKVKALDNRMNGFKSTIVSNVIAEGALVGGLLAVTGTVAIGGVMILPAGAVAAGTYLGAIKIQKTRFEKAIKIIKEAQKGKGPELKKFITKLERKNGRILLKEELIELIVEANAENDFCPVNENTEKVKLMKPRKMMKIVEENI